MFFINHFFTIYYTGAFTTLPFASYKLTERGCSIAEGSQHVFFASLLWPICLPFLILAYVADFFENKRRKKNI